MSRDVKNIINKDIIQAIFNAKYIDTGYHDDEKG